MVSKFLIHFWAQVFGRSRGCSLHFIGECIVLWDSTFISRIRRIFPCSSVSGRWVSAQLWTCRPIWLTEARTHVTGYSSQAVHVADSSFTAAFNLTRKASQGFQKQSVMGLIAGLLHTKQRLSCWIRMARGNRWDRRCGSSAVPFPASLSAGWPQAC